MATKQFCTNDKPTVQQLARELQDLVEWQELAIMLPNIDMTIITTIEENYPQKYRQKIAFYQKWLEVYTDATWSDVIDGLKTIKQAALAKALEEKAAAIVPNTKKQSTTLCHDHVTVELQQDNTVLLDLNKLQSNFSDLYIIIVRN